MVGPVSERRCLEWLSTIQPLSGERLTDQAGSALKRQVLPKPIDGDDGTVTRSDQEVDVRNAPDEPSDKTLKLGPVECHDCGLSSDCRQITLMTIHKRASGLVA